MILLTIRTDKPEAEIGLFDNNRKLDYVIWPAHRELSATLLRKVVELLAVQGKKIVDIQGIIAFSGPGSFTGLRIGLTVADSLAYGLCIPIVAAQGEEWIAKGSSRLQKGESDVITLPEYGAQPHITQQKK